MVSRYLHTSTNGSSVSPELIHLMVDCGLLSFKGDEPVYDVRADEENLYEFARRLIELCAQIAENSQYSQSGPTKEVAYQRYLAAQAILVKLGIKSHPPVGPL